MMNFSKDIIQFDKQKGIVGAIFAALILMLCTIWLAWQQGIIFVALFLVVGCVRINTKKNRWQYILNILWAIVVVWITWFAAAAMLDVVGKQELARIGPALNFLCILIPCGFVFLITGNWKLSFTVASFLLVMLSTVSSFVHQFRGKELVPMDILSWQTALSVAGQYKAIIAPSMVYGWIWWGLVMFLQFSLPKFPKLPPVRVRLVTLLVEIVFFSALWMNSVNIPIKTWDTEGSRVNGFYLNFFLGIRDSVVKKPPNYSPKNIAEYAQNYITIDGDQEQNSMPNVIVIMDESYADYSVLGEELRTSQPVSPFIDSLQENTIRGYALTSVYGGNTANAEFEFLTGHSMGFLPNNSVPYQQYINREIYTLAWLMNSYGYKSVATHPYYATGWSRDRIYPKFGFTESRFIDSYPASERIRGYVSDREMFANILQSLTDENRREPLFLFGITMQNHGGYDYDGEDFIQTIRLEGYRGEYPKAEQYLSLIHETDAAVESLLTALQEYPEDTVVLFFGDHFPGVEKEFPKELHGGKFETLPEKMLQYQIPFFIWANYDIPEQTVECTSISYLSRYLLETAGLELPPYYRFLADVEKVIPAMNALGYYSVSEKEFIEFDEASGEEAKWLARYAGAQYNNLFDAKHTDPVFFAQYVSAG